MDQEIVILHFNDVYDIQEQMKEPIGGVARFVKVVKDLQKSFKCITLFSGDLFAPSALSNIYQGEQMLFPIKECKVDVACPGNHDFDYPLHRVEELFKKSEIPWVLSNVFHAETKANLANCLPHYTKTFYGLTFGFIGLAEEEWLCQIVETPQYLIQYEDYLHCAERLIVQMRKQCDFLVALTHMRGPNDRSLIQSLPAGSFDFVLGGHDHMIYCEKIKETLFLKSGSNFRQLGVIQINKQGNDLICDSVNISKDFELKNPITKSQLKLSCTILNIVSSVEKNLEVDLYVQLKMQEYNKETLNTCFISNCDLHGQFHEVRNHETNLANLYADIIRAELKAEISFFNSGTLRADELIPKGPQNYQALNKIFALPDLIVTFRISGSDLLLMIENGVMKWPNFDGRFLGISGFKFTFNPQREPGSRVEQVKVGGEPLQKDKIYLAASQLYLAQGFDGFVAIKEKDFIIGKSAGLTIMQAVLRVLEIPKEDLQGVPLEEGEMKTLEELVLQQHKIYQFKGVIIGLQKLNGHVYSVVEPQLDGRILQI